MRSYYATLMLALTLSFVSIPSFGENLSAKEGTTNDNSNAQADSARQGGTDSNKNTNLDAAKDSSTMSGSAATSAGSSQSNPFGNVFNTPGAGSGKKGPSSNYVKSTPQSSNYVKSDAASKTTPNPSGVPPAMTGTRVGVPYAAPGVLPSDYAKGTPSNYVTGSTGEPKTDLAKKTTATATPKTSKKKTVSHAPVTRNWR